MAALADSRAWKQKYVADDGTVLYDDEAAAAFNRDWEAGKVQGLQRDVGLGLEDPPLPPRQRIAKLLEAVGLGDYEPEAIAELHVRDRFGVGRPPKPQQQADAERFEALMHLSYGIENWGLDIPPDSPHRPIFDALPGELLEELLVSQPMLLRLVRDARRRVCAISERPWVYDARPEARRPNRQTADRTSPRDRERGQRCSERTRGSRRCSAGSSGGGDPHQAGDKPPGEHLHLGRRLAGGRR